MPLVRRTVRVTYCFKLRNSACYLALSEEVGNVIGKEGFKKVYDEATKEPHSFLTIRLDQPDDMFFKRLSERLTYQPVDPRS